LISFADSQLLAAAVKDLSGEQAALVSPDLPLRANLSARENAISDKRDPDMTPSERFVAKLARALILKRPHLVIERPGAMLYDIPYPVLLRELASRFDGSPAKWDVFDFGWNQPLYN
jgi:hypothetical protein